MAEAQLDKMEAHLEIGGAFIRLWPGKIDWSGKVQYIWSTGVRADPADPSLALIGPDDKDFPEGRRLEAMQAVALVLHKHGFTKARWRREEVWKTFSIAKHLPR